MKLSRELKEAIRYVMNSKTLTVSYKEAYDDIKSLVPKIEKLEENQEKLLDTLIDECKAHEFLTMSYTGEFIKTRKYMSNVKLIESIMKKSWDEIRNNKKDCNGIKRKYQ